MRAHGLEVHDPGNRDFTLLFGGDFGKGANAHVDVVFTSAGGTSISNDGSNGLAIVGVGDSDGLSAVLGGFAGVTVELSIEGDNLGAIGMNFAASAGNAILGEVGSLAASFEGVAAGRGAGGRGSLVGGGSGMVSGGSGFRLGGSRGRGHIYGSGGGFGGGGRRALIAEICATQAIIGDG